MERGHQKKDKTSSCHRKGTPSTSDSQKALSPADIAKMLYSPDQLEDPSDLVTPEIDDVGVMKDLSQLSQKDLIAQMLKQSGEQTDSGMDDSELMRTASIDPKQWDQDKIRTTKSYQQSRKSSGKKSQKSQVIILDLHHKTIREARDYLEKTIDRLLMTQRVFRLKVITGRGRHSKNGPIIADDSHKFIKTKYRDVIVYLQDSPTSSMLRGITVRGYFIVDMNAHKH
ncbi:MAG: Smr/MutS family protein [Proteobacteria bacterium]|nr:Smr/MutS family protein [Pseudomonadota bacterium]